jgi:mRNA-degrading endonuclease RelE of RelBE toxin-antitoxin system
MLFPDENPPFSFRINGLGIQTCIIKVKKITSNNFKGRGSNSGFRLVYAWFPDKHLITLIELYHKSEKALEDRNRILRNFR